MSTSRIFFRVSCRFWLATMMFAGLGLAALPLSHAQTQPAGQQPAQATPDSGGPNGDSGAIAIPKKKDTDNQTPLPPAPAEPKFNNPEGAPSTTLHVDVPEVTVDVGVLLEKT